MEEMPDQIWPNLPLKDRLSSLSLRLVMVLLKIINPASLAKRLLLLSALGSCLLVGLLSLSADSHLAEQSLLAGAHVQDITPPFDSLLINGGFVERRRGKMQPGDLKARCFVLQRGEISIAVAVVDSCMIPRDLCDRTKALASQKTGIPIDRIVIAATHTHSAPSTMDYCLGTMADPAYTEFLPSKIAEGIVKAYGKIEPAQIGHKQVKATGYNYNRRWITRPDQMQRDPFGDKTVRAMMHPGFRNPKYVGPSGPVDDELSVLSIQALNGDPIGVLANFSMHYHGGGGGPADYFGLFSDRLAKQLAVGGREPVCAMTQGTSGDLHLRDYEGDRTNSDISIYTDGLVEIAKGAVEKVRYDRSPLLGMDQKELTLSRRLPDAKRLAWADKMLSEMKGQRPKNRPEVYAEQARYIHKNPTENLVLQTLRIGNLGITTIPNEVYAITGLKLKAWSPFPSTFNIELANGAAGYIPPPEQHALGGYTTWPARTAGLEVEAEPKIVETLLSSFESLAGKPRRPSLRHQGDYVKWIMAQKPLAYFQCEDLGGGTLDDASGQGRSGHVEGMVAYHLPGPECQAISEQNSNNALQLAGGRISVTVPKARTLSFWFWNGMSNMVRDHTGDLVQHGVSRFLRIGGKADGESSGSLILQDGGKRFFGKTKLALKAWHHVVMSQEEEEVKIYLDGHIIPEVSAPLNPSESEQWHLGGELPVEGRLDEVAWFKSAFSQKEAARNFSASRMTPPARPAPPRPKYDRGAMAGYQKAVLASQPSVWLDQGNEASQRRVQKKIEGIGDVYTVEFWVRNQLPNQIRPVTAYLFSRGVDGMKEAEGDHLGIGGSHLAAGKLIVFQGNRSGGLLTGVTELEPNSWHHLTMIREGERVRVYLNGRSEPEIDGTLTRTYPDGHPEFFFGGRSDRFSILEGRLDHVALYDRALSIVEISEHYEAVNLLPSEKNLEESNSGALSPQDALSSIHVPEGYRIELVASEPLIKDPVAIDWGADGKLWVAEMADYPSGVDGKPGGRVRFLEDLDGDGKYEKSTLFLKGLNYPAGIMSWRSGVIVAAAPDLIYAQDTTGDGKADLQEVLYSGFKQGNQQLRVNGLSWGLDNWIHGANGSHHPGYAKNTMIHSSRAGSTLPLGSMDFRIRPDEGLMEALSGPSQFGRARDDWGNSFGVQNSFPLWHYVLEERYLTRNINFAPPEIRRQLRPQNPRVFPASSLQKRFHSFNQSGRFTSACSPMIYRDRLLFDDEQVNALTCEPFHNLVQRVVLDRDGYSFKAKRAEEGAFDFFASEDRWCRPVMARTGPDGAVWVVDMYRYMIEHPEWLPDEGKREMKAHERKGSGYGRIYRIFPKDEPVREIPDLAKVAPKNLVRHLASPNGIVRDLAHRLLVERKAVSVTGQVSKMALKHPSPRARLQALCVLDGINRLTLEILYSACKDPHPQLRRHAVRLAENRWDKEPELVVAVSEMIDDVDLGVRLQVACSLGNSKRPEAGHALAALAVDNAADPMIRAAVMSSPPHHFIALAERALDQGVLVDELIKVAGAENHAALKALVTRLSQPGKEGFHAVQFQSLSHWADLHPQASVSLSHVIGEARKIVRMPGGSSPLKIAAISLLGREENKFKSDRDLLGELLIFSESSEMKFAVIEALARMGGPDIPRLMIDSWSGCFPRERSKIMDTLLQRKEWAMTMLKAIGQGQISPEAVDVSRRQILRTHADAGIKKMAEELFPSHGGLTRARQLKKFRSALELKANPQDGRAVFNRACAHCHLSVKGLPMNGPDLRSITERSKEGLFTSILNPNESVDPSYFGYSVTLKDGKMLFGRVLAEKENNLTLRLLDGTDRQILRKRIKGLDTSGRSLMPDGLELGMTHQNLADLIGFLQIFGREGE